MYDSLNIVLQMKQKAYVINFKVEWKASIKEQQNIAHKLVSLKTESNSIKEI